MGSLPTDNNGNDGRTGRDDSVRVLPFGVIMRDLGEGRHLVAHRSEYGASEPAAFPDAGVRLSPVELRNREMINDPALEGFRQQGRAPLRAIAPADNATAATDASPSPSAAAADGDTPWRLLQSEVVDHLFIEDRIEEVEPGPHGPRALKSVEVHPDNPHFSTDGRALFDHEGCTLLSLMVPCESYDVPEGVEAIGPRAFDTHEELRHVTLPATLRSIGRLSFAKSSIEFIAVPSSVTAIEEKAFFGCRSLKACLLPEGLRALGHEAFALSALERAVLPSTLELLGAAVFDRTPIQRRAHAGSLILAEGNRRYFLDEEGGLYCDGAFAELISAVPAYRVRPGTEEVLAAAFRRNTRIRSVYLPDGLKAIGDEAFRGAKMLGEVRIPDSLAFIGDRAFTDTALRRLRIPAALDHIGESALLVQGENPLRSSAPLQQVEVDPANRRFYEESGLLCERGAGDGGADKVLLYLGPDARVRIPDEVNRIAPFAFLGVTQVDELFVHGHMHSICDGAFSVARSIPVVHVEFGQPVEGAAGGLFPVPSLSPRYRTFTYLFRTDEAGTVFDFDYYDSWVSHATAIEEFAPAALGRLRQPVHLSEDMAEVYRGIFRRKQVPACRYFAKLGNLEALEDLAAWGLLDAATIEQELAGAAGAGGVQATATLLELKKRLGFAASLDLSL